MYVHVCSEGSNPLDMLHAILAVISGNNHKIRDQKVLTALTEVWIFFEDMRYTVNKA